jgi:SH3-like domain-containing protein
MNRYLTLAACLAATLLFPAFGTPALAQVVEGEEHCVINVAVADRLNVREEPGVGGDVVARLRYATCGVVVTGECDGNWCPIEDGHIDGWVNSRFISMVSPALYCVTNVANDDVLNMRAFPSPASKIVTELAPDQCDIAFLPYAVGGWQKVRADGYEGWVRRTYVSGE